MRGKNLPTTEKYVTMSAFEDAMAAIARSFQRVFEEFQSMRADMKEMKTGLLNFEMTLLTHDRKIEDLTVRVEKLEA